MQHYQEMLKKLREEKKLTIEAAASQLNLSETTLTQFEQSNNILTLGYALPALKNAMRKYAEFLGMPERRIVSMLNRVDYLEFKRSRKGKMTGFDYLNRLVILGLIALLAWVIHSFYNEQKELAHRQIDIVLPSPVHSISTTQATTTTEQSNVTRATNEVPNSTNQATVISDNINVPSDLEE